MRRPIELARLAGRVSDPAHGAVALFLGVVREENLGRRVSGIEYSAYEAMAERELARIAVETAGLGGGVRIALEHRIGELRLGEASLGIAVAHARSQPALDALHHALRAVKQRVPIWKREHYVDGSRAWVAVAEQVAAEGMTEAGDIR